MATVIVATLKVSFAVAVTDAVIETSQILLYRRIRANPVAIYLKNNI